jgi:multidrug efflux system membrane fusion protein
MKQTRRWIAAVAPTAVTLACLAVAGIGCEGKEGTNAAASMTAMARPPAPVQVTDAITKDVPVYIDEIGNCTAVEMVAVRPQVAGRITSLGFTDGSEIKKGQVLATIDARPYQAVLDQANANLAQAEAVLSLAKLQLANAQAAIEAHAVSQEELQNRQNAVTVAQAQIRVRQADIEAAKVNLDYCTINSPIDGRAGRRLVDVGNVVKANDDNPLLVIQRMDPIYADFTIPEQRLGEVRRNAASGTLKTLVRLPEDPAGQEHEGELTFLDNSVQDGTGTIKLRATLPNADRHFWPGQFCQVRLVLQTKKDAVLIPAIAQQVGQQGPFVYVAKEGTGKDGKTATLAELRPIVPGQRQGDMIVVDKGVAAGEKVVTVGQMMIMPGGPVQVVPSAPPAGAPQQQAAPAEKKSESAKAQ